MPTPICRRLDVYVGQTVEKGDRLGWSGHTSKDRVGNHLHVGLRPYVGTNRQTAPREYTIPDENRDLKPNHVVLWGRIDFRRFLEGAEDDTIASWRDQQNVIQGHYLVQRTGPHVVTTLVTVPTGGVNIRDSAMLFTVPAHSHPASLVQGRKLAATPKEEDTPFVQVSTEGYVSHDGKRNRDENLTSPNELLWGSRLDCPRCPGTYRAHSRTSKKTNHPVRLSHGKGSYRSPFEPGRLQFP